MQDAGFDNPPPTSGLSPEVPKIGPLQPENSEAKPDYDILLRDIPSSELIKVLRKRRLTPEDKIAIQSLPVTADIPTAAETTSTAAPDVVTPSELATDSKVKPEENAEKPISAEKVDDVESQVEKFARAVERKSIFGKLGGTGFSSEGSVELDNDVFHTSSGITNFGYRLANNEIYGNSRDADMSSLASTQILTLEPINDGKTTVIAVNFFQDRFAPDSRGANFTPAYVRAELPTDMANEFAKALAKNPDLVEGFLQKAFPDLDSKGENQPGLRRIKATGFIGIGPHNVKRTREATQQLLHGDKYRSFEWTNAVKQNTINYKNGPYGSGMSLKETLK